MSEIKLTFGIPFIWCLYLPLKISFEFEKNTFNGSSLPCNYLRSILCWLTYELFAEKIKGRKELTESSTLYSSAICHCQNSPQIKFSNSVWNNINRFSIVSLSQIQTCFHESFVLLCQQEILLSNTESLLVDGDSELSHCEPLVCNIFFNWSIHSLTLCVFLFKGTLFNNVTDLLKLNSRPVTL